MSRPGWELASAAGGVKETALAGLFKGASLIRQNGEAVSVLSALKDKTVLLYFAASWAESCKSVSRMLAKFYDTVRETGDDSIAVIFVSNDKSKEEQAAFFSEHMHPDWLMVEWSHDLQDIMDAFNVENIPGLVVVDRQGKAVVGDALDQIYNVFGAARSSAGAAKAAVEAKWAAWRRLAGDWRASGGHTLGGSSAAASSCAAGPGVGLVTAAGSQSDREALRAARLAALERRAAGGGGQASGSSGSGGAASSAAPPLTAPHAAPAAAAVPSAASSAAAAPRMATIGRPAGASSSSGSGTFASGAAGAPASGAGYTLAGGRVESPPAPPAVPVHAAGSDMDDDLASDMASDGEHSAGMEAVEEVDMDEAATHIMAMGFPEDRAREALQAARGNIDEAVALLVGE